MMMNTVLLKCYSDYSYNKISQLEFLVLILALKGRKEKLTQKNENFSEVLKNKKLHGISKADHRLMKKHNHTHTCAHTRTCTYANTHRHKG